MSDTNQFLKNLESYGVGGVAERMAEGDDGQESGEKFDGTWIDVLRGKI